MDTRVARHASLRFTAGLIALCAGVVLSAVDGDKAMYMGGTIAKVQEKAEGKLNTSSTTDIVFDAGKKGSFSIAYGTITSLEYGQKAGRRVAVAALVSRR